MNRLIEVLQRLRAWFDALDPQRRVRFIVASALSLAITAALWGWAAHDPMTLLFQQPLDPKTTTTVLEQLKVDETPYRLEAGTDRIFVPRSVRNSLALQLRGTVLETASGTYPCTLGEGKFGVTQFVEHVEWVRCMEGQIETQINSFAQVMGADVILSIPQRSLFVEDQEDPSASVHVELKSGSALTLEEGKRMAALVSAAVPRLRPERVEILDDQLRVLHASNEDDEQTAVANSLAERRRSEERSARKKIKSILEPLVGHGNVFAEVHVDMDVTARSIHNVELDPDKAIALATKNREESKTGFSEGGVPGTTANIVEQKAANPATSGRGTKSTSSDEQVRMEVPRKTTHEDVAPGRILGLTAAVVVDGIWEPAPVVDGAEAPAEPVYTAREPDELVLYAGLVARALGTKAENVTVVNRPFAKPKITAAAPAVAFLPKGQEWTQVLPWGLAVLALLLTFFLVVRPVVKEIAEAPRLEEAENDAAALLEAGEVSAADEAEAAQEAALAGLLSIVTSGERAVTRGEVGRLVSTDIQHTVVTLQAWIHEEG